jgi:hypothetical protein
VSGGDAADDDSQILLLQLMHDDGAVLYMFIPDGAVLYMFIPTQMQTSNLTIK